MRRSLLLLSLLLFGCATKEIPLDHDAARGLSRADECPVSVPAAELEVHTRGEPARDPAALRALVGVSPARRAAHGLVRRLGTDPDLSRVRFRLDTDPAPSASPWRMRIGVSSFALVPRDEPGESYRLALELVAELTRDGREIAWRSTCDPMAIARDPALSWDVLTSRDGATLNDLFERSADRCVEWFWEHLRGG